MTFVCIVEVPLLLAVQAFEISLEELSSTQRVHFTNKLRLKGKIYLPKVIYQVISGQEIVSSYFPVLFYFIFVVLRS